MNLCPRAFLIALLLLPACAFAQQPTPPTPQPASEAQQPAPEFLLKAPLVDLAGKPATLAQFHGQPLIINFWARWCGPCHTEIPGIVAQYPRAQSAGVQVVGVALDDKPDAVRDFATAYDINYSVLLIKDQGPALLQQLGNEQAGLPYTLVIDRNGQIVMHKLGAMSRAEMEQAFQAASK
ncbi:MAG: TlpA family protein disulfide reductase [Burkholderiaceae bacterium]|jgi:peroxiredoxin|nr:TlpA family protein disulfide reductase [Burkholderiaceae bacterium]